MAKITEAELLDLFGAEDVPHGPLAARWDSPDKRAERYRQALEGILACAPCNNAVIMLQAVAAGALGYESLQRELLHRLEPSRDEPPSDEPPP